jgi:glycosyltransferase involved in cell wall biosynthesis
VYAGTHSEWHGAGIFVEAMHEVVQQRPDALLAYYGNGEDRAALHARAVELEIDRAVAFHPPIPPAELATILAGATISVASLAPVAANEYALATKVYSSLAAGCPVIFTGVGPTIAFLDEADHPAGVAVPYEPGAVAAAMIAAMDAPLQPPARAELARWSSTQFSLSAIATQVVDESLAIIRQ